MSKLPDLTSDAVPLSRARLQRAIERGVRFLYRHQLPYGEFKTYACTDKDLKVDCRFDSSPFVTAWVVDCIGYWQSPQVSEMTTRAIHFLLSEMEGPGLWRYWSSRNESHPFLPPDVDDTCCISFVLKNHNKDLSANRELILANRNSDGLFYTWMVTRPNMPKRVVDVLEALIDPGASALWSISGILDNIDCAVNANILLYIGECAETQATIEFLIEAVRGERKGTGISFYPDPLAFYYLLSRAYASGVTPLLETKATVSQRVLTKQDHSGSFGNELQTAFGICSLLNFDHNPTALVEAVHSLINLQTEAGAWRRISAFLGPAPYYGSEELTTALCVQALARYSSTLD